MKPLSIARRISSGIGIVGQVERHQRLELHAFRQRGQDALAVGGGGRGRGDRRLQVRHHDRARELARGMRQHAGQRRAVAQVQVPVVWTGDGDGVVWGLDGGHGGSRIAGRRHFTHSRRRAAPGEAT
jgi:hypothetical protein